MSVEKIGDYNVRPLSDGRYSVCVNNGNFGARVCTAEEVEKLRNALSGNTKNSPLMFSGLTNPYEVNISAKDSILDRCGKSFANLYKLRKTEGLSGCDLFVARLHNILAMQYNPFATVEGCKNILSNKF